MSVNSIETGSNILDAKLSRRKFLGLAVAGGLAAALEPRLASAAPEPTSAEQPDLSTQEVQKTQVPLPTPEVQKEQYGYEIEWENGPFGNVTLCIEKNLFEAETNWMHGIDLNTDPETGYPDAADRVNNAIRLGMYRAWQSNKPETRDDVTLEEFNAKVEAGDNVKFKAKGRKGTEPVPEDITINPADPVRLVWLGMPGFAMHDKYGGHSEGFTSNNNETRLEFWTEHYDVPGNGDYGGDAEQYQFHKIQASQYLNLALTIMSVPELQDEGSITPEQEQKYLMADDSIGAELWKLLFTPNPEGANTPNFVANYIFNVS